MPNSSSLADVLRECRGYVVTLETRVDELPPHMQQDRTALVAAVAKTEEAGTRKSQHKALMQQATRDQDEGKEECRVLATRIRDSLRGFFGNRAEALNHFGIQPRRAPRPKTKPPETGPTPPQAATPAAGVTT